MAGNRSQKFQHWCGLCLTQCNDLSALIRHNQGKQHIKTLLKYNCEPNGDDLEFSISYVSKLMSKASPQGMSNLFSLFHY